LPPDEETVNRVEHLIFRKIVAAVATVLLAGSPTVARAQEAGGAAPEIVRVSEDRWWAVGGQVTVDTFYVPPFRSPYENPAISFGPGPALGWSLVASALIGAHLWKGATVVAVGEYSNGAGAPNVSGASGYPDGNMIRVAKVGTAPYLARVYLHQDIALGGDRVADDDEPQPEGGFMPTGTVSLGRPRPPHRLEITAGKFGSNDFLDVAEASSDPRHKFMNWALMQNGAWDYVADTRGYTWGVEVGVETPTWAIRAMAALMPTAPNGSVFDGSLSTSGSYMLEGQYGWGEFPAEGSVRLLGYVNRGNLGSYGDALSIAAAGPPGTLPDVDATALPGAVKYGFALLAQQEIGLLNLFLRLGWNDGKTQTFCFTSIDRSISMGAQLDGTTWGRHGDFAGAGVAVSGLSSSHAAYLAAGGTEFQLGDGALTSGWEVATEVYYSLQPVKYLQVTADLQAIVNPGMNAARGPAFLGGIRVHAHF
jgi:high affinity Mn2+ porin